MKCGREEETGRGVDQRVAGGKKAQEEARATHGLKKKNPIALVGLINKTFIEA